MADHHRYDGFLLAAVLVALFLKVGVGLLALGMLLRGWIG